MKKLTPLRAIRAKCLDCCIGSSAEVKGCITKECSLWQYRLGTNPNRTGIGRRNPKFGEKSHVEKGFLETK